MVMKFNMVVYGFTSISNMVGDNDFVLSFDYLFVLKMVYPLKFLVTN